MPVPALLATLGTQAASQLVSGGVQSVFNQQNERSNLGYYNMQRQHALQDWQRQNDYNAPKAQMQRLIDAGISPYAMGGNALLAGATQQQVRGSSMNVPSAYQVNGAQNALQTMQLLEQAKLINAQRVKTEAETKAIELNTNVDSETLRSRRFAEIWQMEKNLSLTGASIEEKQQQVQNMKATLSATLQEIQIKKIQEVYENDFLKGRNELQNKQLSLISSNIARISAEIAKIKFDTERDKTLLPFQLRKIQEEIGNLKLQNEFKNYENLSVPDYNYYRNENLKLDRDKKANEMGIDELSKWLNLINPMTRLKR